MSALNFDPKSPMGMAVIGIAAVWLLTQRRNVAAASQVRPSAVGASTVNGNGLTAIVRAITSIPSLFGTQQPANPQAASNDVQDAARAAVRSGDPYYGSESDIAGSVGGWSAPDPIPDGGDTWGSSFGSAFN